MQGEKLIKITKKDGSFHIVPAMQRPTYEAFNLKSKKLKKESEVFVIEDYEAPAETPVAESVIMPAPAIPLEPGKKTAAEIIDAISKAANAQEVTALAEGDGRVSVIKAAETKIAELTK